MFKGEGVDQVGVGTLIRRVLGLKTAANRKCDLRSCDHAMTGNSYINTFDGMPACLSVDVFVWGFALPPVSSTSIVVSPCSRFSPQPAFAETENFPPLTRLELPQARSSDSFIGTGARLL